MTIVSIKNIHFVRIIERGTLLEKQINNSWGDQVGQSQDQLCNVPVVEVNKRVKARDGIRN